MLIKEVVCNDFLVQVYHSCIAVSDIIGDRIIIKRYIGYTEEEAINLFNQEYR